jgi:hypothetical protein
VAAMAIPAEVERGNRRSWGKPINATWMITFISIGLAYIREVISFVDRSQFQRSFSQFHYYIELLSSLDLNPYIPVSANKLPLVGFSQQLATKAHGHY